MANARNRARGARGGSRSSTRSQVATDAADGVPAAATTETMPDLFAASLPDAVAAGATSTPGSQPTLTTASSSAPISGDVLMAMLQRSQRQMDAFVAAQEKSNEQHTALVAAISRPRVEEEPPRPTTFGVHLDEAAAAATRRPYPDAPVSIPADLVRLFQEKIFVPLSLLTLGSIREWNQKGSGYRQTFTIPLSTKASHELKAWRTYDLALDCASWSQASFAFFALWRAELPEDKDGADMYMRHVSNILMRASDRTWPIWALYDRRIRDRMFETRKAGMGINFSLDRILPDELHLAEEEFGFQHGAALALYSTADSPLLTLTRGPSDRAHDAVMRHLQLHHAVTQNPGRFAQTSASSAAKLDPATTTPIETTPPASAAAGSKRARQEQPSQRAAGAPPNGGGNTFRSDTSRSLCFVCLTHGRHTSKSCPGPGDNADILFADGGWRRRTWKTNACTNWAIGVQCFPNCRYTHRCLHCDESHRPDTHLESGTTKHEGPDTTAAPPQPARV